MLRHARSSDPPAPAAPFQPVPTYQFYNRSCQKLYHETKKKTLKAKLIDFSMKTQQHFLFSFSDECYDVLPQVLCERRKLKGYCSIEGWKDYLRKNCADTCAFCGKQRD